MADILLPELGEGITSVEISEVLVKKGDTVKVDDPIIVVETEKASMEIPTTESGTVENVQVEKGGAISPGDVIISITGDEDQAEAFDEPSPPIAESAEPRDIVKTEPTTPYITAATPDVKPLLPATSAIGQPVLASPSVRRFARELGCDLKLVTGSGPKGRIAQEDVQEYIKGRLAGGAPGGSALPIIAPGQDLDFSKWGEVDIQPLNKIKKITGKRLQQAWQAIPHVTQFDKADITKLDKLRLHLKKVNKDESVKVSFLPFFIKAVSILLKEMPQFNSSLDGSNENIVLKKYINIGVAVDTPNGLVVPVIKDANEKSIKELARELTTLSSKARDKKLLPADMEGGCFTISSLGGIGGTYFTPIINPPEVAILGISRSTSEPVFMEGKLRKRLILPFALSYDHRLIDGAAAARFTSNFGQLLSNFEEIT
ncbi:MAG TPA: branched-chain alpha-keto acid dehydrogenase subunit E2 [Candidatus Marinimicrobia bacterium]|nr:branched-chain alpha-keto acid dehydrogenase subunit E2 [Candidatus Neomarinimicrobiota bacterium]